MVAMSYGMLSVYFQRTGARSLGRLLLEAEADAARDNHDNVALARVLCNLNADFNCDDTVRACEYGLEAIAAARSVGDQIWLSVAAANLLIAQMLRGTWDDALALADEPGLVTDLDAAYLELVRYHVLRTRGLEWTPGAAFLREGDGQDEASAAVRVLVTALQHADAGQQDAADLAVTSVRQMLEFGGLFDDFGTVMIVAVDLAAELGDVRALAQLVDMIDGQPRTRPPLAARLSYHRALALAGVQAGADPDEVEAHFHAALADARSWRSEPWLARVSADLAVWLSRHGRSEEAVEPLRAAREGYARLGAARWSEQLEAALAGVRA